MRGQGWPCRFRGACSYFSKACFEYGHGSFTNKACELAMQSFEDGSNDKDQRQYPSLDYYGDMFSYTLVLSKGMLLFSLASMKY